MNRLSAETSPYLLQHAKNPVDWFPWGEEAFQKARSENKLLIISIGYSACHWCHVMEHESFEDMQVAKLMNDNYVCVKVDREERPDVDQLYMDAANLMIGRGGWPLNAFALPDGRPVYAGTYFPKPNWMGLLHELTAGYKKNPQTYIDYAEKLLAGIRQLNLVSVPEEETPFTKELAANVFKGLAYRFDKHYGGMGRAPKFPMPDIYNFLLHYHHFSDVEAALDHVNLTLTKMACGGIYDQLHGGFARYSVDDRWLVPHFEKMLYDNAQLISLYSLAYKVTKNELFRHVVYNTFDFLNKELSSPEGGFYCALDADSEGEEGKYYVWTKEDFENVLTANQELLSEYFGIGKEGYWEEGKNILIRPENEEAFAEKQKMDLMTLQRILKKGRNELENFTETRVKPGLDDKILLSWNALAIKGLIDAYTAFQDHAFLDRAEKALEFLISKMISGNKVLHAVKGPGSVIKGFLEDYSFLIDALIAHHEATLEKVSILKAKSLLDTVIENFSDPDSPMFFFTSGADSELASRKIDTSDNVTPSPNSVLAHAFFRLGKIFEKPEWVERSKSMLQAILPGLVEHPSYYSNWARLLLHFTEDFREIVVVGDQAVEKARQVSAQYLPSKVLTGGLTSHPDLPLTGSRHAEGKTFIYVCTGNMCEQPVEEWKHD